MPFISDMKSALISSGQTNGVTVEGFEDSEALSIWAPAALTGTITIQVSPDRPPDVGGVADASKTWATLQSGGSDITLGASKMVTITDIAFRALRMVSTQAEGSDRTFKILKQVYPTSRR